MLAKILFFGIAFYLVTVTTNPASAHIREDMMPEAPQGPDACQGVFGGNMPAAHEGHGELNTGKPSDKAGVEHEDSDDSAQNS